MFKKYIWIWSAVFLLMPLMAVAFTDRAADSVISEMTEPVCFTNGDGYSSNLDKIPQMFRQEPVLLGVSLDIPITEDLDVFVVVKISVRNKGVLHYSLNSWQSVDKLVEDESEIEKICFGSVGTNGSEKRMVVKLLNGKVIAGNVNESEGTLALWSQENFPLKVKSADQIKKFEEKIKKRTDASKIEGGAQSDPSGVEK